MPRMTLEKLALLMQDGFNNLHEAMLNGFDKIAQEFVVVKGDIEDLRLRVGQKANKIDLDQLSKKFDDRFLNGK